MARLHLRFLMSALVVLAAVGSVVPQIAKNSNPVETAIEKPAKPLFAALDELIHYGDLIDVDVVGSTEYDWRGKISPEGYLSGLSFTESPVFALCKTGDEVAREIAGHYSKFLKDPEVRVQILDRSERPYAVLYGAVKLPQRFHLLRGTDLRELIVLSGGFSENTGGLIQILRQPQAACVGIDGVPVGASGGPVATSMDSQFLSIRIDELLKGGAESNPSIQYGDVITVTSARPFFVTGAGSRPGKYPMSEGMNVARALEMSGVSIGSKQRVSVRVFRREGSSTKVVEVISDGKEIADPATVAVGDYDIVEVFNGAKTAGRYPPPLLASDEDSQKIEELPVRIIE